MCSSSLTMPVCGQWLLGVFATIADPRGRRGRRHDLAGVLAIATAAVCAGASSLVAIAEWAADVGRDLLATSGLLRPGRRVPSESTIRRILQALDLSCRSLVTQDFLDYCCGVGGYVGLGGDGLTGDLDGDLA